MATRQERCEAGELFAVWNKKERDILYWSPRKPDGHLAHSHLSPLFEELERRGYDLTTLRFSIKGGRPTNYPYDEWQKKKLGSGQSWQFVLA